MTRYLVIIKALRCWRAVKSFLGHYLGGLYDRTDKHHIFLLASGLSFSIFVCIIPMTLIIFSVLGIILEKPSVAVEIESFIDHAIPYQDYAASIKQIVFARVNEFRVFKGLAGLVGVVGLLFASSGLFSSMRTILHTVYQTQKTGSVLIGKLHDIGLVFLVMLFFLLSTTVLPGIGVVKSLGEKFDFLKDYNLGFLEELALLVGSFIIIWAAFYIIYFSVPHQRPPNRSLLISSFSAAVLWKIAERLFGYYITHFLTFKRIYGTYSFLLVAAFWIFYTSIVFILGAEIGQLYRERKYPLALPSSSPPDNEPIK